MSVQGPDDFKQRSIIRTLPYHHLLYAASFMHARGIASGYSCHGNLKQVAGRTPCLDNAYTQTPMPAREQSLKAE